MSTTTNLALNEPAYNSTSPTWDQPLNYNATILDQMFGNTTGVSVNTGPSTYTPITAPSPTAAGSTSQCMRFNLTGALSANQTVLLPQGISGMWVFTNATTNAYTVTIGSNNGSNIAAGTTVSAPQGYSVLLYCDGTNVKKADDGFSGTVLAVSNGGTGSTTLTANNVILGNGTSAVQFVAPGTSGNVLTSNGTTWTSASSASGGALIRAPQILTSGTSYTTPSTCNHIYVEAIGGGGGAGSNNNNNAGGGGGGYVAKYFNVSPSTSYSYAIGSGGAATVAGGNTTFTVSGTTITATGGGAGGSAASGNTAFGGAGGVGTNGDLNGGGSNGGYANYNSTGGVGGNSMFGGGGLNANTNTGGNGTGYGGGGSGGGSGFSGGSGTQGMIRIWEYT